MPPSARVEPGDEPVTGVVQRCVTRQGSPRWLWIAVVTAAVGLAIAGGIGVVLAMAGLYRWWAVLILVAPPLVAVVPSIVRLADAEPSTDGANGWAVVAVVAAVCIAGWSASRPGHHVITSHDPGVYASTAKILQRSGQVRTEVGASGVEPLVAATVESSPGASVAGPGAYEVEAGVLEYQFSHAPSAVMAVAASIGGTRLFFALNAAVTMVGLLGVYLLATRFASAPLAFAASVALGISIPVLYVSRSTYSEPFSLVVVCTGLALVCRPGVLDTRRCVVAGFLFGSSVLFRIDGQLVVIAMIALGVVAASTGTRWRPLAAGLGAAMIPAAIGLFDLAVFSTPYWRDQNTRNGLLAVAAVAGVVAAGVLTILDRRPQFQRGWTLWMRRLAGPMTGLVAVVLAWAWLLRPSTQVARAAWEKGSNYDHRVEGLQAAAGLAADGTRSYAELTVASIGWYFGAAFVALAILGLSLMVWRSMTDLSATNGRLAAFFVVAGSAYLIDWQITPYQPWAARRFVTAVLPIFAVAAAAGATAALDALARFVSRRSTSSDAVHGSVLMSGATWVLMASIVVPTAVSTWPVRDLAEQRGFQQVVEQSCDVADGATVLSFGHDRMAIPMRAWCGTPAVSITGASADAAALQTFAENAKALCQPGVVVVSEAAYRPLLDEASAGPGLGEVVEIGHTNPYFPEESIVGPPARYDPQTVSIAIASVELPDSC